MRALEDSSVVHATRGRARRTSRSSRAMRNADEAEVDDARPRCASRARSGSTPAPRSCRGAATAARAPSRRGSGSGSGSGSARRSSAPTRPTRPTSQNAGWSAAIARPPSSGEIGQRLKRLRKKPMKASAMKKSGRLPRRSPRTRQAPSVPTIGPASATFASRHTSSGSCLSVISAPRNGMNIGAHTGRPWRFASSTWPSSCTNRSRTNPTANYQPQSSAYAAIETRPSRAPCRRT